MDADEVERIIQSLATTMEHQRTINEDLRASIADIRTFIAKQDRINERLTTLLETLGQPPHNGQ